MSNTFYHVISTGIRQSDSGSSNGVAGSCVFVSSQVLRLIIVALFLAATLLAQDLPAGWRSANAVERSSAWRKKSQTRFFRVEADFDGDGKSDIAELLINPTEKKFAIFVQLASAQNWQMLGEPGELGDLNRFAIDLVKPGKYQTACGKGYGDSFCAHGEPNYLVLKTPGIDFIYTESADSIFYWDAMTNGFREIAMSD